MKSGRIDCERWSRSKRLKTGSEGLEIEVPRDRLGIFKPTFPFAATTVNAPTPPVCG